MNKMITLNCLVGSLISSSNSNSNSIFFQMFVALYVFLMMYLTNAGHSEGHGGQVSIKVYRGPTQFDHWNNPIFAPWGYYAKVPEDHHQHWR